jgi:hypothetical protein
MPILVKGTLKFTTVIPILVTGTLGFTPLIPILVKGILKFHTTNINSCHWNSRLTPVMPKTTNKMDHNTVPTASLETSHSLPGIHNGRI